MKLKNGGKMKKYLVLTILALSLLASGCATSKKAEDRKNSQLKYSKEYVTGKDNIKGDVDVEKFEDVSEDFEIGANELGYAVFKNPDKAMSTLKEKYLSAINLIKDEFNLKELSNDTITEYKNYGDQLTKGTKEEKKQAAFVSEFLDIYENSFKDEK